MTNSITRVRDKTDSAQTLPENTKWRTLPNSLQKADMTWTLKLDRDITRELLSMIPPPTHNENVQGVTANSTMISKMLFQMLKMKGIPNALNRRLGCSQTFTHRKQATPPATESQPLLERTWSTEQLRKDQSR